MNKYKKEILSNKIPLITVPISGAKTATVLVMVKTGSKYENRKNNGISHFLEHMFFKGTKKRPDTLALSSELDSLGGEYNAFTSKEYTGYWVKAGSEQVAKALDIVSDMLTNSLFLEEEIEREKGVIIEELNMYEDNPLMHIEDVFESCLYGDTPAGWETIGTKDNIRGFHKRDFVSYYNSQYGAASLKIVLAGQIKEKDRKLAVDIFSRIGRNSWRDKTAVKEKQKSSAILASFKKTDQLTMSLGVRSFPIGHKQEFQAKLLSVILGGSMSSRLFINLRERNGLAYYVRTMSEVYSDSGYLTTQAGIPADKAAAASKIILSEYKRLTEELVSEEELRRAKDLIKGRMLMQMESSDNIANWYARQLVSRQQILSPEDYLNRLEKISAKDLRATALEIFQEKNLNLAAIGPLSNKDLRGLLKLK